MSFWVFSYWNTYSYGIIIFLLFRLPVRTSSQIELCRWRRLSWRRLVHVPPTTKVRIHSPINFNFPSADSRATSTIDTRSFATSINPRGRVSSTVPPNTSGGRTEGVPVDVFGVWFCNFNISEERPAIFLAKFSTCVINTVVTVSVCAWAVSFAISIVLIALSFSNFSIASIIIVVSADGCWNPPWPPGISRASLGLFVKISIFYKKKQLKDPREASLF